MVCISNTGRKQIKFLALFQGSENTFQALLQHLTAVILQKTTIKSFIGPLIPGLELHVNIADKVPKTFHTRIGHKDSKGLIFPYKILVKNRPGDKYILRCNLVIIVINFIIIISVHLQM